MVKLVEALVPAQPERLAMDDQEPKASGYSPEHRLVLGGKHHSFRDRRSREPIFEGAQMLKFVFESSRCSSKGPRFLAPDFDLDWKWLVVSLHSLDISNELSVSPFEECRPGLVQY